MKLVKKHIDFLFHFFLASKSKRLALITIITRS